MLMGFGGPFGDFSNMSESAHDAEADDSLEDITSVFFYEKKKLFLVVEKGELLVIQLLQLKEEMDDMTSLKSKTSTNVTKEL